MGRKAKYRNAAEKQKAYRERKKLEQKAQFWQSEEMQALRKKLLWCKQFGSLEVTVNRLFAYNGTVTVYHVLAGGRCHMDLGEERFEQLLPVLTLKHSSRWLDRYTVQVDEIRGNHAIK